MTPRGETLWAIRRDWFWPSEVAVICNVSRKTIYKWIERGTLIPILNRRPFKVSRSELSKILSPL
jgi:excisionase family DNA binding protein